MSDFKTRLRELRNASELTQEQFGEKVGVSKSAVSMWERGERYPDVSKFGEIADYFNVDMEYLVGKVNVEHLMGWDDEKITSKDLERVEPNAYRKIINVLGRIPAGEPNWVYENVEEMIGTDDPRVDYALRVKGDSMINAGIFNGSIVYVQREADYNNGDIVIAVINGDDATVKRYYKYGDKVILKPENPSMKEKEYDVRDVELRGKVLSAKIMF